MSWELPGTVGLCLPLGLVRLVSNWHGWAQSAPVWGCVARDLLLGGSLDSLLPIVW